MLDLALIRRRLPNHGPTKVRGVEVKVREGDVGDLGPNLQGTAPAGLAWGRTIAHGSSRETYSAASSSVAKSFLIPEDTAGACLSSSSRDTGVVCSASKERV